MRASVERSGADKAATRIHLGVSSLKEVGLSSGFSRFFSSSFALGSGRTLCAEAIGLFFERLHHDTRVVLPRKVDELAGRAFKVCSSGPVAVVLVFATAPQVIPSCIHFPYGKRSGRLVSGNLARYCSVRPSCATKLIPIRVTSYWDRSRRIHDTPRTEQGPQGS